MQIIEIAMSGTIGTCEMGPVSTEICELANRFAARGHDVVVADVRAWEPRALLNPRVRVLEIDATPQSRIAGRSRTHVGAHFKRWRNVYRFMNELSSALELSAADVVHCHAPLPAFLAQRLHGLGSVCFTAHTPTWSLRPSHRRSALGRLMQRIERDVIRRSRVSVGLGDYLAAAVPGAHVVTIPNGLDLNDWPPLERAEARQALGIGKHEFMLVFVGRIAAVKGVDTLLDAVAAVGSSVPQLRVCVIGPMSGAFDTRDEFVHPYARAMRARAQDLPVQFLGFINKSDERFNRYLAAADALVLPSRAEPQGMVVLEALAMGTPVIGSATGGIPDMVSSDVGFIFEPGNADALADCIRQAHDQPEKLAAMRAAARGRVQSHYSSIAAADRYLEAFEQGLLEDLEPSATRT